jgi:hypothetical protein
MVFYIHLQRIYKCTELQQEDYIKRQIDQIGRVLGKILSDLIGLKARGQMGDGIELTSLALKKELDLDIGSLTSVPTEEFINTLKVIRTMNDDSLEMLADIFLLIAEEPMITDADNENRIKLFERSLTIYEHLDRTSSIYSFDRHIKIEKIKIGLTI